MATAAESDILDNTPLTFGKYRTSTPNEVAESDPRYLVWAFDNVLNRPVFMSQALYNWCKKQVGTSSNPTDRVYKEREERAELSGRPTFK